MTDLRIGFGIDVHPFVTGRKLYLGGIEIPSERGLAGHSDADCLLHALTDALLGATGQGDIGSFFPPSEIRWKDVRSTIFVEHVWEALHTAGWRIGNVDCSVLLEEPRLRPHIDAMRGCIAELLDTSIERVAVKATTSEKLGFIGRGEGVVTTVAVLLHRGL